MRKPLFFLIILMLLPTLIYAGFHLGMVDAVKKKVKELDKQLAEKQKEFEGKPHTIWTRTYNGPANGDDEGYDIAVDGSGNVYIVGYETVPGEDRNIWVRKYDPDGNVLWTSSYDVGRYDVGYGIAVDRFGDVYVTGREYDGWGDIWVRKYYTNGSVAWTRTYDGISGLSDEGHGIAVDEARNGYVVGYENAGSQWDNIWVRKYDTDGDIVWTRTYNALDNGADLGYGIAVDRNGNVYVIGSVQVSGEGDNIWVSKCDAGGYVVWTRTYDGTGSLFDSDRGQGIAVDGSGNVYVIGYEEAPREYLSVNIWVRKYDSEGNEVWTKTYDDPENGSDTGYDIAVDGSGNVYVTGYAYKDYTEGYNIWVREYDSEGNEVWTISYNGTADGDDYGQGIAVDASGNIYVTGFEYVAGEERNIWIRKYAGPSTATPLALPAR